MSDTQAPKPSGPMPYVLAVLILFLIAVILIGVVLFLRPAYDPLVVIASVSAFVSVLLASIAAFIKAHEATSQAKETHHEVNSKLSAWKVEFFEMAHAKGIIEGTEKEQARVAEQKRIAALPTAPAPAAALLTPAPVAAPIPVIVENPAAIPVKLTKD